MKPKKYAITGNSGYFGKVIVPLLEADVDNGHVIGIDRVIPDDHILASIEKLKMSVGSQSTPPQKPFSEC